MGRGRFSKVVSVLVTGIIAMSGLPSAVLADVINAPTYYSVQSGLEYEITTNVTSSWINHTSVDLVVSNTGDETIHNWYITFNTPYTIDNIWNGTLYETDGNGTYTITSNGWNQDIHPGETVTVGTTFSSTEEESLTIEPEWYLLNTESTVVDADLYTLDYIEYSSWESGFTGQLTLQPQVDCQHWGLSFASNREITAVSSATLITDNTGYYEITHDENNMRLFANNAYNFGIQGVNSVNPLEFTSVELAEVDVAFHLTDDVDGNGIPDYLDFIGGGNVVGTTPTSEGTPLDSPAEGTTGESIVDFEQCNLTLNCNNSRIHVNSSSTTICFYASLDCELDCEIELWDLTNDVKVADFYDNGNYYLTGDDILGDGVYSCNLEVDSSYSAETVYQAFAFDRDNAVYYSNPQQVVVYDDISPDYINDFNTVNTRLNAVRGSIDYSNTSYEQQYDLYWEALAELSNEIGCSGSALVSLDEAFCDDYDNCIYFKYNSGIWGSIDFYGLNDDGVLGSEFGYDGGFLSLYDLYPLDDTSPSAVLAHQRTESYQDYIPDGFSTSYIPEFSVDDLRNELDGNSMVVITTHGALGTNPVTGNVESLIVTMEDSTIQSDLDWLDMQSGRIIPRSNYSGYKVYPSFLYEYYNVGDFEGCVFIVTGCRFMGVSNNENFVFAQAFTDLGAEAVVGYINKVYSDYEGSMNRVIIPAYYSGSSIGSSVEAGCDIYGETGGAWLARYRPNEEYDEECDAIPWVYGNSEYCLSQRNIVNGSFERGFAGWFCSGDYRILNRIGYQLPSDGMFMSMISTGIGAGERRYISGNEESFISQSFVLPSGVSQISFDYNMISEEPMEFVGSRYDDSFEVLLVVDDNETIVLESNSVNSAVWRSISGVNFTGGDNSVYHTGWNHCEFDVSQYEDQSVRLYFVVSDIGDSAYDTAVLIDDVYITVS